MRKNIIIFLALFGMFLAIGSTGSLTANQIGMDGNVPGGTKPTLMYFFSTTCDYCNMQEPIIEELEKKYGDKVNFNLIDVDENQQLAITYGVNIVPTVIIMKYDVEVKRFFGVTDGSVLEFELNKNL
jgi:thioredoxin 1